jgi:hypothetical protein
MVADQRVFQRMKTKYQCRGQPEHPDLSGPGATWLAVSTVKSARR